jgi:tRNA 2-selenouridine synthase
VKYPASLSFQQVFPKITQFDAVIDVRSPLEFEIDHIPKAINWPVLSNAQRIEVGTIDKQVGSFEARKIGAAYASENIAAHLKRFCQDKPREWAPLIYCWRGGNRSSLMAHIFAKIGWPVVRLDGGYKDYRHYVISEVDRLPAILSFRVICGPTGSGKSRLLQKLANQGAQVLDLELLACHKGSVLGANPLEDQPSQKSFESKLWEALCRFDPARIVYVESESKKIGNLHIPETLMRCIRTAPCVMVNLSQENRVKLLLHDYPHFSSTPSILIAGLGRLVSFHGRETISRWQSLAQAGKLAELYIQLLEIHYDPAYSRSFNRNFERLGKASVLNLQDDSEHAFAQAAISLQQME